MCTHKIIVAHTISKNFYCKRKLINNDIKFISFSFIVSKRENVTFASTSNKNSKELNKTAVLETAQEKEKNASE